MIWPCSGLFDLYDFENGKKWRHMNFYFQLILKSPKKCENLDFSIPGLCLAFKKYFGLFSILLTFRCLEYSKSFKFESFGSNFAIKNIFAENFANWISVIMVEFLLMWKGPWNLWSVVELTRYQSNDVVTQFIAVAIISFLKK